MVLRKLTILCTVVALLLVAFAGCGGKKGEEGTEAETKATGEKAGPGGGMPGGGPKGAGPGPGGPGPAAGPGGPKAGAPPGAPGATKGPAGPGARTGEADRPQRIKTDRPDLSQKKINDLLEMAMTAKKNGDMDAAMAATKTVMTAEPENTEANWIAAWLLARKDDPALAIGQFERVLKLGISEERAEEAKAAIERLRDRRE